MDPVGEHLKKTQETIHNVSISDIDKIVNNVSKLNIVVNATDVRNKLKQLDNEIRESVGMIEFMHQKIDKSYAPNTLNMYETNKKLNEIRELIKKIVDDKYLETEHGMFIKKREIGETWNVLKNIFSMFIETKENIDVIYNSTESYSAVSEKIAPYIDKCLENIMNFDNLISGMIKAMNNVITSIDKNINIDYNIKDVKFVNGIIPEKQTFKLKLNMLQKLSELIIGYDGLITDETSSIIASAFDNLRLEDIQSKYISQLNKLYEELIPVLKRKFTGIDTIEYSGKNIQKGGSERIIKSLYVFNLELQKVQKLLRELISKWKEYQHYKLRFYNYYLYQIYCLSIFNDTSNNDVSKIDKQNKYTYQYIDKEILEKYNNILINIIKKFGNIGSTINDNKSNTRERITYMNIYHYFTIKQLHKLFEYLLQIIGKQVIDVKLCSGTIRQSLILFNCFKDILDVYE